MMKTKAIDKILDVLRAGGTITQPEAYRLGTIRLGGIIFLLRQKGHKIKTVRGYRGIGIYYMKGKKNGKRKKGTH